MKNGVIFTNFLYMVLRPKKSTEMPSEPVVTEPISTLDEKPTGQSVTTAKDSEDKN